MLGQARDLLTIVGNQSNLILDPDLDSYYVMSLTLLRLPELLQVLLDTHNFMANWGLRVPGFNPNAQLLTLLGRLDAVQQGLESDYEQTWLAGSPELRAALGPAREPCANHSANLRVRCMKSTVPACRANRQRVWMRVTGLHSRTCRRAGA